VTNTAALAHLIDLPQTLTEAEQKVLHSRTAWPLAQVTDGNTTVGFIMHRAPSCFWGETAAGTKLRELQYLLYEPRPLWQDIGLLDTAGRLEFVHQTAELFKLLHRHDLIVGDVSMKNLLWSPPPVRPLLLDCDGIRPVWLPPVLARAETPDWIDPLAGPTKLSADSDRYKLALLVGRVLTRRSHIVPGEPLRLLPNIPPEIADRITATFADAAGAVGTRPTAAAWLDALAGN
jgi:DNA-binding helix-hairpin-helix protein with protein kinase domain